LNPLLRPWVIKTFDIASQNHKRQAMSSKNSEVISEPADQSVKISPQIQPEATKSIVLPLRHGNILWLLCRFVTEWHLADLR
jgi:hypothetical protein